MEPVRDTKKRFSLYFSCPANLSEQLLSCPDELLIYQDDLLSFQKYLQLFRTTFYPNHVWASYKLSGRIFKKLVRATLSRKASFCIFIDCFVSG